jgi:hypothetical protein
MAGKIVVSTLNNDTGVLATQNGMTGIAKAWVNFAGASGTVNGSFNVSSVTRNGTGDYTVNFTTAMPNTNYCYMGIGKRSGSTQRPIVMSQANTATYDSATGSFRFVTWVEAAASIEDPQSFNVSVFSS